VAWRQWGRTTFELEPGEHELLVAGVGLCGHPLSGRSLTVEPQVYVTRHSRGGE